MVTNVKTAVNDIDVGLRNYMIGVYNNMGLGLLVSGIIAYIVGTSPTLAQMVFGGPQAYLFIFAPLVAVLALSFGIEKMSVNTARLAFYGFAAIMGISLSSIFITYQLGSIFQVLVASSSWDCGD
jgi:FtsH-binding integral membrane protein